MEGPKYPPPSFPSAHREATEPNADCAFVLAHTLWHLLRAYPASDRVAVVMAQELMNDAASAWRDWMGVPITIHRSPHDGHVCVTIGQHTYTSRQ